MCVCVCLRAPAVTFTARFFVFLLFFLMKRLFSGLNSCRQHVDKHRGACPHQVDGFHKEAEWLIRGLTKDLEDQFKLEVQV